MAHPAFIKKRSLLSLAIAAVPFFLAAEAHAANTLPANAISRPAPIAPANAPNVVMILSDDVGFSMNSTFGGAVPTPNYDHLAAEGLLYNQFHTTAQCTPTRAALLTGRNPHRVNMGTVINLSENKPGYTSMIPKSAASIGRILQLNGYSTSWFGKNHITPDWELTSAGPFDRWPTGMGFDYFYGFMEGWADQFHPALVENTVPVAPPQEKDYILDKDLANHAISWFQSQKSIAPSKPVFMFMAPGSVHVPQQALPEWIDRFKGKFDQGWDKLREETFSRQKQKGIIPEDTVLTPRPDSVPAWESLSEDQKRVSSRMMEVAAAQSAYMDHQMGRLFAAIKASGQWDNTLVIWINGDNGASMEGGLQGKFAAGGSDKLQAQLEHLDEMGGPRGGSVYPVGWAWAMDAPFQYWKQISGHLGGIRNGLVISWPDKIHQQGIRKQFGFVTDIAPTIYQSAGITYPDIVDGVEQMPLQGNSLVYTFEKPDAPAQHTMQYFEINGHRGIYKDGWLAGTTPPSQPWQESKTLPPLKEWAWELYNLNDDFTQSKNIASSMPEKLEEMKAEFERATKADGFTVRPSPPKSRAALARTPVRPYWFNFRNEFEFHQSDKRISDSEFPELGGRSWQIEADLTVDDASANGTIISQGSMAVGWGIFLDKGQPTFLYTPNGFSTQRIVAQHPLKPGKHTVSVNFTKQGNNGAQVEIMVDGHVNGSGNIASVINRYPYAGIGIGRNFGTQTPDKLASSFAFDGVIDSVKIKQGEADY